jgi:3-oxosteroid 1-dehydrogenase
VPRSVARADTIPELAARLGIDAEGLESTVARFNRFVTDGVDQDFGRGAKRWRLADRSAEQRKNPSLKNPSLGALTRPPFYGLELRPSLGTSSAGLLADANGQVLHQRRHPIPGLYASGVVAVRNELGAGYQAGLNLASAMTFSYLAARHMQKN